MEKPNENVKTVVVETNQKQDRLTYSKIVRNKPDSQCVDQKNKPDATFNSHKNATKTQEKKKKFTLKDYSDIESESEWDNEGPLKLAPNPNKRYLKGERKDQKAPPCPQRVWRNDQHRPAYREYNQNNQPNHREVTTRSSGWYSDKADSKPNSRSSSPQRPSKVDKISYHITEVGSDGEDIIEENQIYKDDFQVYRSVAYKKKIKRLEKLKKKSSGKGLTSMKEKIATRFVLTKVDVNEQEDYVEEYLLENFDEINEVHVRKNEMRRHNHYASFVFIVYSEEEIDIDMILNHDWPGKILCFHSPNVYKPRY